jgi:hypothetical protein
MAGIGPLDLNAEFDEAIERRGFPVQARFA